MLDFIQGKTDTFLYVANSKTIMLLVRKGRRWREQQQHRWHRPRGGHHQRAAVTVTVTVTLTLTLCC